VQHYIPASKGDNSMASSEEERLVNEVDELQSQLKHAGDPIDPELSKFFYDSIRKKSTAAERVTKWTKRVEVLKQRLERASASAAVSLVVAHHDLQQNEAVPNSLKRKELPEPDRHLKTKKAKPNCYVETVDKSAPKMNQNHVDFIRFCVDELKKEGTLKQFTQEELVHNFKAANPDKDTRFANSVFQNRYINSKQLNGIACGDLPFPIVLPFVRIAKPGSRKHGQPNLAAGLSQRKADGRNSSEQGSESESPDGPPSLKGGGGQQDGAAAR
jgi:hypothetical protein